MIFTLKSSNHSNDNNLKVQNMTLLTNNAVSLIELEGVAKTAMGMEMCKACQPHSSVCVCEGEGDTV